MKILALETSGVTCSVATLNTGESVQSASISTGQRSSQALAPAIDRALRAAGWRPSQVELVAVTSGPGSFTGLRVGVTTAKAIAYSTGAKVVGVDTLAVIARQQTQRSEHLTVVLDAYRGQLFVAEYRIEEAHIAQCLSETQVVGIDDAIRRLPAAGSVTGPGLARIHDRLPVGVCLADDTQSQPTAGTVAELGWEKHVAGQHESLWELIPNYFRRSAAEERFGT